MKLPEATLARAATRSEPLARRSRTCDTGAMIEKEAPHTAQVPYARHAAAPRLRATLGNVPYEDKDNRFVYKHGEYVTAVTFLPATYAVSGHGPEYSAWQTNTTDPKKAADLFREACKAVREGGNLDKILTHIRPKAAARELVEPAADELTKP